MDLKETRVPMAYLVLKVHLVLRADKDPLDHQANLVKRVKLVFLASLVLQEEMDCQAFVVCPVFLDPKEILGRMVLRERWDHQDQKVTKGLKEI